MNISRNMKRASRRTAQRGLAVDVAAKIIADELFRLGDEPDSPTQRIEFRGGEWTGSRETERAQGGLSQIAFAEWLARALERHAPNTPAHADGRSEAEDR